MLNAEQAAQGLNMSRGFAYKIIQEMNEGQIEEGSRGGQGSRPLRSFRGKILCR